MKSKLKIKSKYWYNTNISICVLCSKKSINKKRVFNIADKNTSYNDTACHEHF